MWREARGWQARWRTGGGAHAVIDPGGIDVPATDLIGICRPPVPHVFDAQHRATLFGGDALAQLLMPARDIDMRIMQPQGQIDPPAVARPLHRKGHVVTLIADLAGDASRAPLVV